MKNYIRKIRSKLGHDKFIHPAARIIIENEAKEILIIERADNGQIGLPAGALEEGETIEACILREVREETGLRLTGLEVIGISSHPGTETVTYPNGDRIQYFTVEFYSNQWEGTLQAADEAEVRSVRFADKGIAGQLPDNERSAFDSLQFYRQRQMVMLK